MKCQAMVKSGIIDKHSSEQCDRKAVLRVLAFGGKSWDGFYCSKHAGRIIRLRTRLIRKYNQNVIVRPITVRDRKYWRRGKTKKRKK